MEKQVTLDDGRVVDISNLGGLADVAEHYGYPISTMTTWVNRYDDCPAPVRVLRRGPLYVISDWADFTPPGAHRRDKAS